MTFKTQITNREMKSISLSILVLLLSTLSTTVFAAVDSNMNNNVQTANVTVVETAPMQIQYRPYLHKDL